jgi:hypothetical protein
LGLGTWPKITLQHAREAPAPHRRAAQRRLIEARKRAAASAVAEQTTFGGYADGFVASKCAGWRND